MMSMRAIPPTAEMPNEGQSQSFRRADPEATVDIVGRIERPGEILSSRISYCGDLAPAYCSGTMSEWIRRWSDTAADGYAGFTKDQLRRIADVEEAASLAERRILASSFGASIMMSWPDSTSYSFQPLRFFASSYCSAIWGFPHFEA
jgi:hypothetical protein